MCYTPHDIHSLVMAVVMIMVYLLTVGLVLRNGDVWAHCSVLSALGMAEQTHRVSLEAQSLQSPRESLPTPTTQVARSLDSLGSPLPGGQYVAIVCSSFSGRVVAMAAGVTAAMENTFFALYANLTLMWGAQSQEDPLCT